MDYETVIYEQEGPLVTVRLNRPQRLNAYSKEMRRDLNAAFAHFVGDPSARVAIVTGVGRAFCAGRDIKEQAEGRMDNWSEITDRPPLHFAPRSEKPIVTAVNGYACGVGFYLCLGGDIRVASETAQFNLPQLPTGLPGCWDVSMTQGIPWAVAMEIQLLGRMVPAQRMYEIGLLNKVVAPEDLQECALEYAHELLALPPQHLAVTMRMHRRVQFMPSEEMWKEQDENYNYLLTLSDTAEAAAAFAERRPAAFTGT